MEYRIKDYTIKGQRILLPRQTSIEDLRLIFNETKKKLICSTATKDNVSLVQGEGVTLVEVPTSVCSLKSTDLLTIKCDYGDNLEEVKEAVENIDLTSIESKVQEESAAIQNKLNNLNVEVDLTPVAKEEILQEIKQAVENGGGSGLLEEFWDIVPDDSEEIISEEDIHAAVEDIWNTTFNS